MIRDSSCPLISPERVLVQNACEYDYQGIVRPNAFEAYGDDVCMIADVQGLFVRGNLLAREVAIASNTSNNVYHFTVDLRNVPSNQLIRASNAYIGRRLIQMTIYPATWERSLVPHDAVAKLIKDVFDRERTDGKYRIAFRGNHHWDYFRKLNLLGTNLQFFGCDETVAKIRAHSRATASIDREPSCGVHVRAAVDPAPCSLERVLLYRGWYRRFRQGPAFRLSRRH